MKFIDLIIDPAFRCLNAVKSKHNYEASIESVKYEGGERSELEGGGSLGD